MKKILIFMLFFSIYGCNKPKTVLICGDHICINKAEAQQYFEDNLSLEVKILDKKKDNSINLVELNLQNNTNGNKNISITTKEKTDKKLKILSNNEIEKKKAQLKNKRKNKKNKIEEIARKKDKLNNKKKIIKVKKKETIPKLVKSKKEINNLKIENNVVKLKKTINKSRKEIVDICNILKDCSIEEISKYLIENGKAEKFPDITTRE